MKRMRIPAITLIVFFMISAISCKTVDHSTSNKEFTKQYGDITVTVSYLSRDELIRIHGKTANPFIDFPSIITQKDLLTFRLSVESTESSLEIRQRDILFTLGNVSASPLSENELISIWENYNNNGTERTKRMNTSRKYLGKGTLRSTPDEPLEIYLVFAKKFPPAGEGMLTIPAQTGTGDQGLIEVPFNFVANAAELNTDEEGNIQKTGVFEE